MDLQEKIDNLLVQEEFQNDILNCKNCSPERRKIVLEKYGLNEKEYQFVYRFLSGFSFKKDISQQYDIDYALVKLKNSLSANTAHINLGGRIITWISRIAAVLLIPLAITTYYYYQKSESQVGLYPISAEQTNVLNTFTAPPGAKTEVVLPDGSLVWLNSGSTIKCPAKFNSKFREVKLNGEAYFEVVKNPRIPMIVEAGQMKVKVYGTKFNVQNFADENSIETTLVEGKVTIIPKESDKEVELKPGYSASYNIHNAKIRITEVEDMDVYVGWKDGKLLFHNDRFSEILKKLQRWYNVDIHLEDQTLGNYTLYATFYDENIEQILDILSNSIPIIVKYKKRIKQADGSYSRREIIIDRDPYRKIKNTKN